MASQDNLLNRIARLVAGFDDASWEALASKGLLRRARKDMEKGLAIEIEGETTDVLKIKVTPFLVSIPISGPAKSTCTCPAAGVCQHILAAGLYLQAQPLIAEAKTDSAEIKTNANPDAMREEICLLTLEHLKSWAGSTDYKAGLSFLEKNSLPTVIEYMETVLVRLMPSGMEVRFVPGGGLDGMILPKLQGKRAGVAAVLALRRSLGLETAAAGVQPSLIELTGAPRTKKEILASARAVLEDAVMIGLSHLSPVTSDRLVTLAVSAQGANLPRVAMALKTVSDEVKSILQREARADESRLFLAGARLYALMEALSAEGENPRIELAGVHRAQYVVVPEIELSGVGAYTWQTGSGYNGLTVLFWSNQTQEFLSWSEARPAAQQFDPRQRFHGEGPWDGTQSPRQIACSRLKLRNGRRTANGRLSSSSKASAVVLGTTTPNALAFGAKLFSSWNLLRRYVHEKQPVGLREANPLDLIGILEPSAFGEREFDSITQTFSWEAYDDAGHLLTLSLPFRDWSKDAIRVLEELRPREESRWQVLARFALRDDSLSVEPISIFRPEYPGNPILQLAFDVLPRQAGLKASARSPELDEDEESLNEEQSEPDEAITPSRTYLYRAVMELNRHLQAIAETGSGGGLQDHGEWIEKCHQELHSAGLTSLARVVERLGRTPPVLARTVLLARYLSYLHGQASTHL